MKDYSDWRVWKEVELHTCEEYLSKYEEYTSEKLSDVFNSLIKKASYHGLEGVFLKFESTMEPYEDYLGPVSVKPCGYRKLNSSEKEEYKREDNIRKLAKELNTTEYKAKVVYELREEGKI